MKKIISCLVAGVIFMVQLISYADWNISDVEYSEILAYVDNNNQEEQIKIIINGKEIPFDQAPIFVEDNTLVVPVRAIAEGLGKNIKWNQASQTVIVQDGINTSVFEIGNKQAYSNKIYDMDIETKVINDRTLIPLKSISEIFGADASYDKSERAVIITCDNFSDNKILEDIRRFGLTQFSYFADTFVDEHLSDDWFSPYVWSNALSNLKDYGKKIILGQMGNYEKDLYKESMKNVLSNITSMPEDILTESWGKDIFKKIKKDSDITYDDLKKLWEEEWTDQTFELSNWGEANIGKYIKTFGNSLDKMNTAIDIGDLSLKSLSYLLANYTQQQLYIDAINKSIDDSDADIKTAVEELQVEYSNGVAKAISEAGNGLEDLIAEKMVSLAGGSISAGLNTAFLAIDTVMNWTGSANYSENVESAMITMCIASNLRLHMLDLLRENYDFSNDAVSKKATKQSWNELKNSFTVTKAALIEAYKCMIEITDNSVERTYLKEQLDLLDKIQISETLPTSAENMFYLKQESTTYEGSAPGLVTSDGTYMYMALGNHIYREDITGRNRTPIYNRVFNEYEGSVHTEDYKYKEIQYDNGMLHGKGTPVHVGAAFYAEYNTFEINLKDLSIKRGGGNFIRSNITNTEAIKDKTFLTPVDYQKYNEQIWFRCCQLLPAGAYSLYVSDLAGNMQKLIDDVDSYCVYNGYVYYILDRNLYRFSLRWKESELLVKDLTFAADNINIAGDWIYLFDNGTTWSNPKIYRGLIDDYVFSEVTESEIDKVSYTENKIVSSGNNASIPTPNPTPIPVQNKPTKCYQCGSTNLIEGRGSDMSIPWMRCQDCGARNYYNENNTE